MTTVSAARRARARWVAAVSPPRGRVRLRWDHPGVLAVGVWLLCLPIAIVLPDAIDISPLTIRGSAAPLIVGLVLVAAGVLIGRTKRVPGGVGLAAGAFAGWVVLTMHTGLHGTPYGFGGLVGDAGRLAAQAERYTTTVHSADGIVGSVPAGFPPLFPWLVGRASAIAGVPAWQMLGIAEALAMSVAILAGFLLWRRLVPDAVALAVTIAVFAVFMDPARPYQVIALILVVPWALATFATPARGRLGWLAAGILGGVQILLYPPYLMFSALGILAMIVLVARSASARGPYLRHVGGVVAVSLVVSSWYFVPILISAAAHGAQVFAFPYANPVPNAANPFPFLSLATPLDVLTAIGVLGLVWYRRRAWWALPLILLTLSVYVYRFGAQAIFVGSGNTLLFASTTVLATAALTTAGVLTLARAVPAVLKRMSAAEPSGLRTLALAVVVVWAATSAWYEWIPGAPTVSSPVFNPALTSSYNEASAAFRQPLPDGSYPRYAPAKGRLQWFPVDPVVGDVQSVLGPGARPVTLSTSEQLFATEPWPGFIAVDPTAAAGTSRWSSRFAALQKLSHVTNASAFGRASAHTADGPIGVFILRADGPTWDWTADDQRGTVRFKPNQFASPTFAIFRDLPSGLVMAVRR
ncbi:MAG TPA: arabinofuranosyltransferase [Solirubrobacteraceae bacterium]|nr:arabinofuranosyltransferase [Solirubrobacteraceae bacterium]